MKSASRIGLINYGCTKRITFDSQGKFLARTGKSRMSIARKNRLKSRMLIDQLMNEGDRLKEFPLRLIYKSIEEPAKSHLQLAVSVPKRLHKHAVARNLLKRRIRESWRLNVQSLDRTLEEAEVSLAVMIIYMSNETLTTADLQDKIILLLERLEKNIANPS